MKKICPGCGKPGLDGSEFCGECGRKLVDAPAPAAPAAPVAPAAPAAPVSRKKDSRLVDAEERVRYSLKNGYIDNLLISSEMRSDDALITDRRLYYTHKYFTLFSKTTLETRVDLDDISGMSIIYNNPWNWIVLAILSAIAFVVGFVMGMNGTFDIASTGATIYLVITFSLFFAFLLIWYFRKQSYLKIEYSGGSGGKGACGVLEVPIHFYGLERIREFQKEIFRAKDELRLARYGVK